MQCRILQQYADVGAKASNRQRFVGRFVSWWWTTAYDVIGCRLQPVHITENFLQSSRVTAEFEDYDAENDTDVLYQTDNFVAINGCTGNLAANYLVRSFQFLFLSNGALFAAYLPTWMSPRLCEVVAPLHECLRTLPDCSHTSPSCSLCLPELSQDVIFGSTVPQRRSWEWRWVVLPSCWSPRICDFDEFPRNKRRRCCCDRWRSTAPVSDDVYRSTCARPATHRCVVRQRAEYCTSHTSSQDNLGISLSLILNFYFGSKSDKTHHRSGTTEQSRP